MSLPALIREPLKRRRVRLTLGFLMFATALIAVWLAGRSEHVKRQRAALAAIKALGGHLDFECDLDATGSPVKGGRSWVPRWLHNAGGVDYFHSIARVYLSYGRPPVSDKDVAFLSDLTELRVLAIYNCQITDQALSCLPSLPHLRALELGNTLVGDASARNIESLTELDSLSLGNTHFTDAGLTFLRKMTKLRKLNLMNLPVTDAGLANLENLSALEKLNLRQTRVTEEGLIHLSKLSRLKTLGLWETKMTTQGVATLQNALPKTLISSDVTNPKVLPHLN